MEDDMSNNLELKIVNELNQYTFFIPSYQRGYKWTDKEVKDLLNDINDFKVKPIENTDEKTWYCLQPIVVKKKESLNEYEVIDGQQRLTTIYLILNYLNQDYVQEKRDKLFIIEYQTRENTKVFLDNLDYTTVHNENIDYFYISSACKTIYEWFEEKDSNFDKNDFRSKLKFYSKVIWYECLKEDPISIFTRINMGKIPLTNSELIKALFLNSSNFDRSNPEKLKLRQLEIASEWDLIEHSMRNDKFWYFISGQESKVNRIEFIFDLMNTDEKDENDSYSTFRFFSKKFRNKTLKDINEVWKEVKKYYQRFSEWYNERELYHKIGYLINTNFKDVRVLFDKSCELRKNEFRIFLDQEIKESLKSIDLSELQYGDKNVSRVLLLYNIITMLSSTKDNSYFPFDIFKNEKWDIEHITSIKDSMPDKNRKDWLNDAVAFIDEKDEDGKKILENAQVCDVNNENDFKSLFESIVTYFNKYFVDEDVNDISNLTLLDSETNRGYKNAVFPLKRKTIINRDKKGVFIPLCTKNVFLKYFSEYPPKISFWTKDDREKYEEDLFKTLNGYIERS